MKKIARRQFIINACHRLGLAIGFTIIANKLIVQGAAAQTTMNNSQPEIGTAITRNTPETAQQRILVVYASQFGSTREIAQRIADRLTNTNKASQVDLLHAKQVESLDGYDAIIIGGAIQYDRWMGTARSFVEKHKVQVEKIPFACFFACLTLSRQDEASLAQAQGYAQKISALFTDSKPLSVQGFAGVLDYSKMSFAVRIVAKVIMSVIGVKEGDYRDWPAIDNWADNIALSLLEKSAAKKSI